MMSEPTPITTVQPRRVVILCKRQLQPDSQIAQLIESELARNGFQVFIDRAEAMDVNWAREIGQRISSSDAIIPVLSAESASNEMLACQIEIAHEASQTQRGRPCLLPVRVNYTGPLPDPVAGLLNPLPYQLWEGAHSDLGLITELLHSLQNLPPAPPPDAAASALPAKGVRLTPKPAPAARPEPIPALPVFDPVGGALPLHSEFYLTRQTDLDLQSALARNDAIILLKGARQMGKTSLLARGLQYARERGAKVVMTDFQKLNAMNLESPSHLYLSLAESLADELDLPALPTDLWDERRGANLNFERFLRREVLDKLNCPLVWGLDEVDRLFVTSFHNEVFGLFRSWYNARAVDPASPWNGLTLAIAYATEAHLFITDLNQSPFNVGTRLAVEDFTMHQVAELNTRYREPLRNDEQMHRFFHLVGGHPYLVNRGLYELATHRMSFDVFATKASHDDGIFGDHLRRMLIMLAKDPVLTEELCQVLRGASSVTPESFYRLRSAGIIAGASPNDARPRCLLYGAYLRKHLL